MEDHDGIIYLVFNLFEDSRTLNNNLYERNKNKLLANLLIMRFNQMLAEASSRAVPAKLITVPCNMKDMDSVFK